MNPVKYISVHRTFILNHIEVGTVKIVVDLTKDNLTNGVVRQIMAAALHAMQDNELTEIYVKTSGYSEHRDAIMKSYDCHRYGGQSAYRLVDATYEERSF